MSIGNHPDLPERTWSGSTELDCGDLGMIECDVEITYATDGNSYARGDYKVTAYFKMVNQRIDGPSTVEVDLTSHVNENAIDQIMNDYIVS